VIYNGLSTMTFRLEQGEVFWSRTQWSNYMNQVLRGLNLQPLRIQPQAYSTSSFKEEYKN